jgi:hypothetical protein
MTFMKRKLGRVITFEHNMRIRRNQTIKKGGPIESFSEQS